MSRRSSRSSAARALERRRERRGTPTLKEALDEFVRAFVSEALERNRIGASWNKSGTARDLDIPRSRLQRLIDRFGLKVRKRQARRRGARDHR